MIRSFITKEMQIKTTTAQLFWWLQLGRLILPSVSKDVEQYELTCQRNVQLIVRRLWERVWKSPKNGNTLPIWPRHSTTSDSPRKREWCPFQDLHTHVQCSVLCNRTQSGNNPYPWVTGLPKCGLSVPWMLHNNEWELKTDVCNRMDESQNNHAKWKKPDRNDYILHDSMCMKV